MDLIQQLEQEEIARLGRNIPDFAPGDTVVVSVNVVEGNRKRAQVTEPTARERRAQLDEEAGRIDTTDWFNQ